MSLPGVNLHRVSLRAVSLHSVRRRAATTSLAVIVAAFSSLFWPSVADARSKRKTTEPPVRADEYRPAELADAIRSAALPIAVAAGATLGNPVCPSGVKRSPTMAAQCLVAFDSVSVPYVVAVGTGGALIASPLFVVAARRDIERELAKSANANVGCGKSAVLAVPSGSAVACTIATRAVDATILRQGTTWTVTTKVSKESTRSSKKS